MFEAIFVGTPVLSICQNLLQKECYKTFDYEFMLDISDIKFLNRYLDNISAKDKRSEIVRNFREMEVGLGKDEMISELSEIINSID